MRKVPYLPHSGSHSVKRSGMTYKPHELMFRDIALAGRVPAGCTCSAETPVYVTWDTLKDGWCIQCEHCLKGWFVPVRDILDAEVGKSAG